MESYKNYKRGDLVIYCDPLTDVPILCKIIDFVDVIIPLSVVNEREFVLIPIQGKQEEIWTYESNIDKPKQTELMKQLYV